MPPVVLDLDGTLVDSVPLHVVTWQAAFAEEGVDAPSVAIHDAIGMGATRLVRAVLGRVPDEELEKRLVTKHKDRFLDAADRLQPTPGAVELLEDLVSRKVPHVVATSAGTEERRALLATIGDPDVRVTDADQVESSKPAPEPIRVALEDVTGRPDDAVMIGDSPWDGHAARAAGIRFIGVRSGGFHEAALREAGAALVRPHPRDLVGLL